VRNADGAFARLLLCSISPGPITLAGLMDPDTYEATPEVAKLDRQKELARYDLFPMYPTCEHNPTPRARSTKPLLTQPYTFDPHK
jgi:hypothetical protein